MSSERNGNMVWMRGVRRTTLIGLVALMALLILNGVGVQAQGNRNYSLRFYGNGINDIDRVKIEVDDPEIGRASCRERV